jgi:hypothetical protein
MAGRHLGPIVPTGQGIGEGAAVAGGRWQQTGE